MAFHEVRLPARLAFGSTGGVERRTEIVTLGSGFERRSTPWAQGRRRYLIGANLRSLDDMAALTGFFELWTAALARIRREAASFVAELEGPMASLERVVGRTYGRDCDALLGDHRCGVDLATFPAAACDKRWATCVGTFGNGGNFQGFPDIPGDDFLMAAPVDGGRHDGGSRR